VLTAGFVIALACNVIGTQAFVTAQNLERAANPALVPPGGESGLDTYYLSDLGADVIPEILVMRERLPLSAQTDVTDVLEHAASVLRGQARNSGWPSWNLARQHALDVLTAAGF
jgi:hypothetical protein